MKELEIRFIEDKIDILYGYENVFLDIINTKTPETDLERFKLEDKGSYFSHTFKRECKSTPNHGDKKLTHACNGRNDSYRSCGTGSYLALFKVTRYRRGPYRKHIEHAVLRLLIAIKADKSRD